MSRIPIALFLLSIGIALLNGARGSCDDRFLMEDVSFSASCDGSTQHYVLMTPPAFNAQDTTDVLIAFHGHGSDRWQYVKNPRDECRVARDVALKHGMLFVSPDYRAKTSWMGPQAESDVLQIIGELKRKHRVGRIFLCGGSMGGTSCLSFAVMHPELVAGVASMNGTANLLEYENFQEAIQASYGGTKAEIPEEYKRRSAEYWPERLTMPIGITLGGKDGSVPPDSVRRLAGVLETLGRDVLVIDREDTGHSTNYADGEAVLEFVIGKAKCEDEQTTPRAVLPGVNADPHIAVFGNTFYIYPTTDGTEGWRSTSFQVWSSSDLVDWKNEGVILDLPRDVKWADVHAWAPAIATKNGKYYYYFSADKNIGVAVADRPEGPFVDPLGKPLVAKEDYRGMQCIDPMVFVDEDGAAYLYWGQGRCRAVPLNDDMISFVPREVRDITPPGYNEGPFVHKRNGKYYLSWSEFDTRDPRYSVAYGVAETPLGPFKKAEVNPILKQRGVVKGAGHHSIVQIPGRDEWVIAYHRFRIPDGNGYNRETCLSPLGFNEDGTIRPVDVYESVGPVDVQ